MKPLPKHITMSIAFLGLITLGALGVMTGYLAAAGFLFGAVGFAVFALIVAALGFGERSGARTVFPRIEGHHIFLMAAGSAVVASTGFAAAYLPTYAWLAILLAGSLFVISVFYLLGTKTDATVPLVERHGVTVPIEPPVFMAELERLKSVDIFKNLDAGQMQEVASLGHVVNMLPGAHLTTQDSIGDSLYVILDGSVKLSAGSRAGDITVRHIGPGESFPLAALLGDGRLITSSEAMTQLLVWRIDRSRMIELFRSRPDIAAHVYQAAAAILAERYRRTLWSLTESANGAMRDRELWANV